MRGYIYLKTIIATGKKYIGKCNGRNKYYRGSGVDFKKDYDLFVKDHNLDVTTEILEYVDDLNNLNDREIFWLNFYNASENEEFYNKINKSYGRGKFTDEEREALRLIKLGHKQSPETISKRVEKLKGQKRTIETKQIMSLKKLGTKDSSETREKKKIARNKRGATRLSPVKQIDIDTQEIIKIWNSQKEAALALNLNNGDICNVCKGKQKTCGGFIWSYA